MSEPLRVGVLASGRGSNFRSLVEAAHAGRIPATMVVLISDRETAPALDIARNHGIEALFLDPKQYPSREAHEKAIMGALEERRVDLVCHAGYMRILTPAYVAHFRGRAFNIHPSLLPAFPGLHTHQRALEAGVRFTGCTVHYVRHEMDTGPIILQAAVPVLPEDDAERLAARVLAAEHEAYPAALRLVAEGRVRVEGERAILRDARLPDGLRHLNPPT